ncbi:heparan-alpha-glucosaminide N-acetyltransferase domain-containing protein [Amycolatopsis sp. NPDC059027]|uniref:heparan-alpha-glucosaminide N-acetyltransferase domain-containing protein n=1 Tax=unclassified Amycolatopsis TaxID=2618356 RepID=UPI0036713857
MSERKRLVAIDATRGIALVGMMAVHSLYESTESGAPTLSFTIFGGRAAAAFAVLAGVTIAFLTGRRRVGAADARGQIAALVTRALAIAVVGLVLGYTDASIAAVILPYYGVMFLLAIPLVFLPTWLVGVVGAALAGGVPVLMHYWLPHLPKPTLLNPTWSYLFEHPLSLLSELTLTGEYPALSWLPYLAAGIVIGRLKLSSVKVAAALLTSGVVMAVSAAVVSSLLLNRWGGLLHIWLAQKESFLTTAETADVLRFGADGTVPPESWWWLAVDSPHTSTPPDLVGTTGTAVALLGALLLLGHVTQRHVRRVVRIVLAPLAAAGSMTLTLYTVHVMFINSDYDTYDAVVGYFLQVCAVLLIGLAWRATAGKGPLEALVSFLCTRVRRLVTRSSGPRVPDGPPPPINAVTVLRVPEPAKSPDR